MPLPTIGSTLSNGSTLLAIRTKENGDTYVLCIYGKEFATWFFMDNGSTVSGHYHGINLPQALESLATR